MEIFAESEAKRLNLYHLAFLFFHEAAEQLTIRAKGDTACIFVSIEKGGEESRASKSINLSLHKEFPRAENAAMGQAFAQAAKKWTDYVPPYGLLFGVRPVKVPVFYRKSGFNPAQTKGILREEFFVSFEKAELLMQLCETELSFEKSLSHRDAMLYLSIPFCPTRCRYCSFISSSAPKHLALIPAYLEQMQEEIRKTAELMRDTGKRLNAVYMGGGTPGILSAQQMKDLLSTVQDAFDTSALQEFCVEVGRPDTVTEEKLSVLKGLGVGRISINPQTIHNDTLSRIGRGHTAADFYRAMELADKFQFDSVNCDLIAGLEGESCDDFLRSVETVLALSPQEITLHALCRKRSAEKSDLPENQKAWQDAMLSAHGSCINQGLAPYYLYRQKNAAADLENTGFAKKGRIGIYNLAMMEDLCDIFACGAGGIGKLIPKETGQRIRRFPGFKYPFEYLSDPERFRDRIKDMRQYL